MTAKARFWWEKSKESGELVCRKLFPLELEKNIYKKYVRPVILYGGEPSCLK